jgi:hypothetical protein
VRSRASGTGRSTGHAREPCRRVGQFPPRTWSRRIGLAVVAPETGAEVAARRALVGPPGLGTEPLRLAGQLRGGLVLPAEARHPPSRGYRELRLGLDVRQQPWADPPVRRGVQYGLVATTLTNVTFEWKGHAETLQATQWYLQQPKPSPIRLEPGDSWDGYMSLNDLGARHRRSTNIQVRPVAVTSGGRFRPRRSWRRAWRSTWRQGSGTG